MPEDYQGLFDELIGGTPADAIVSAVTPEVDEANITSTPEADTAQVDDNTDTTSALDIDSVKDDKDQNVEEILKQEQSARAFAAMRAQNSKYQKVMNKLQATFGVESEDAVIERLLDVTYKAESKKQNNTDPNLLRRLAELEEGNQLLVAKQREEYLTNSFADVQKEFTLSDKELISFAERLQASNIDVFASNVDLVTLYRGLNHEAITAKRIETEKQNWIKDSAAADKAPGVNSSTGKKDTQASHEINTMAELDLAMRNLSKIN